MSDVVTLGQYFIDHLPSIITAGGAVYIGVIQHRNGRRAAETNVVAKQISYDLRNGVGEKIATRAAERMAPALVEAATVAADKIVVKAEEVAASLARKEP